jgi:hypothetical protein
MRRDPRGCRRSVDRGAHRPAIEPRKLDIGYQKHLDHLYERAAAGDWAAVRDVRLKDYNSYTKMVMDYRQRLLLASLRRSQRPDAG